MKYIIIKSFNQGDWFSKDYCLVKVDDEIIKTLERIEIFTSFFQFDLSLFDSVEFKSFHKFNFEFYEKEEDTDTEKVFQFLLTDNEWDIIELTGEEVSTLSVGQVEILDAKHSLVEGNRIQFKAYNKYGDSEEIWTESINIKELLKKLK